MEMLETQPESESNTFEEFVEALKKTGNNIAQAKILLAKNKCGMFVSSTEEEDLYSWVKIPKNWEIKIEQNMTKLNINYLVNKLCSKHKSKQTNKKQKNQKINSFLLFYY